MADRAPLNTGDADDVERAQFNRAGQNAPTGPPKASWLKRNWIPVLCVLLALVGLALALINLFKGCDYVVLTNWTNVTTLKNVTRVRNVTETISVTKIVTRNVTHTVTKNVTKSVTVEKEITKPRNVTEQVLTNVTETVPVITYEEVVETINQIVNVTSLVPKTIQVNYTATTKSENPANIVIMLDGSSSIIEREPEYLDEAQTQKNPKFGGLVGDGMGIWRKEKEAAIKLVTALGKNLTQLTVGAVQFSGFPGNSKPQDSLLGGKWLQEQQKLFPDMMSSEGRWIYKPAGSEAYPAVDAFIQDAANKGKIEKVFDQTKQNCSLLGYGTSGTPFKGIINNTADAKDCTHGFSGKQCPSFTVEQPYCPGQYAVAEVSMSNELSTVQTEIDKLELMQGGTDFASPLSLCHFTMQQQGSDIGNKTTKKFCVLVSDGEPDPTIDDSKSELIDRFCRQQNLTDLKCGTEPDPNRLESAASDCCTEEDIICLDGTCPPKTCDKEKQTKVCKTKYMKTVKCCSMDNVMYRIKELGYIIFGIYAQPPGLMVIPGFIDQPAAQKKTMSRFASCETGAVFSGADVGQMVVNKSGNVQAGDVPGWSPSCPTAKCSSAQLQMNPVPSCGEMDFFGSPYPCAPFQIPFQGVDRTAKWSSKHGNLPHEDLEGVIASVQAWPGGKITLKDGTYFRNPYAATLGKDGEYDALDFYLKNATNGTVMSDFLSNYDENGKCLYYAAAQNMRDLENQLDIIANAMIQTIGVTKVNSVETLVNVTTLEEKVQQKNVTQKVVKKTRQVVTKLVPKTFTKMVTTVENVTEKQTTQENVTESVPTEVTEEVNEVVTNAKQVTRPENVTDVEANTTAVGTDAPFCIDNPFGLIFIPIFAAPLACYIFWWPISIFLAKMLLKNKGPIHGRKRRMIAQKAYDVLNEAVQQGTAGDPKTQVFVQSNIPCRTSEQTKVYTLDAHILDNPKDPKSGHAATVDEMKADLFKKSGVPPAEQHLVYKGNELKDGTVISDYDLQNNSTVFLNPKPMPVKIKARMKNSKKPKVIELDADQSYSVDQVKQALKEAEGLPISHQQLWCNGNELQGMVSLSDLPEGAELSLNPITGKFPIMMVNPNGDTKPLELKATHKIGNVKKRLQKEGVLEAGEPTEQHLVYNGQEIGDKQCAMDFDIPENGMVFLNPKKFRMPMKKPNGEAFDLEVDPSYTVDKVKQAIKDAGGVPEGMSPDKIQLFMQGPTEQHRNEKPGEVNYQGLNMQKLDGDATLYELGISAVNPSGPQGQPLLVNPVFVKDKIGQILPVTVSPSMPVEELKVQIMNATGIPVAEQSIIYEPHSVVDGLPDGQPLSTFGVPENGNAMLSLNPNRLKFNVKTGSGDVLPIDVDMTDTIDKVKAKIMDQTGTPVADQKIFYNGTELTEGDMIDNDISEGANLLVNPVMIQPVHGKAFPVEVTFQDSVKVIEAKIAEHPDGNDITPKNIVFRGQNLDNSKTLASYGVGDGAKGTITSDRTLYVNPKPIQLSILGNDGATYPLTVDKSWSIDQIKQEITQKAALAPQDQHLFVIDGGESRELEVGTTLLDNGIIDDLSLYLNPKDLRVFVKLPNGKAIVANLNSTDTPYIVRQKVEKIAKMGGLSGTSLIYGVEEMAEDKCLAEYDVVPDSTIRMTNGTAQGADGKKWDVEGGAYVRGVAANIKVDYGKSGIAPPSSKIGGDSGGLSKLKGAADVIKVKNMMEKMQAQIAAEEGNADAQETEEEKNTRIAAMKQKKLAMMRHAALEAQPDQSAAVQQEKKAIAEEENHNANDLDYKYTLCLMKCCPCLRPETEEEVEAKNAKKLGAAKKADLH